jgi:hypothetical protein
MSLRISAILLGSLLAAVSIHAQSPVPVVVQAATGPAITTAPKAGDVPRAADSAASLMKLLQDMKAANDETIRKQTATLEQLDELQKAADQLRIFAKRS